MVLGFIVELGAERPAVKADPAEEAHSHPPFD
jgi:hypothetical protein